LSYVLNSSDLHCQSGGKSKVCSARHAMVLGADIRKILHMA